jgi:hypothetical protein
MSESYNLSQLPQGCLRFDVKNFNIEKNGFARNSYEHRLFCNNNGEVTFEYGTDFQGYTLLFVGQSTGNAKKLEQLNYSMDVYLDEEKQYTTTPTYSQIKSLFIQKFKKSNKTKNANVEKHYLLHLSELRIKYHLIIGLIIFIFVENQLILVNY